MNWRRVASCLAVFCACSIPAAAQMKDYKGFKDPELLSRMPNYYLTTSTSVQDKQFDSHEFQVKIRETERVEGRLRRYHYVYDPAAPTKVSALQIIRNYQGAMTKLGGTVVFEGPYKTTMRLQKDGKDIWVEVAPNSGSAYTLWIVEREGMKQDVVGNAEAFREGIATTGHVEVPGIFFDTAKADIKPESEPALKEVVKLLQASPALRVWVVGHTDSVGAAQANVTLSNARAEAVVKALVQMGCDAKRLAPHGAGPYAPVATNTTDEGRAKNRRVELVAQ
jgi:OOP family OmpA-OmpF porin